MKNLFYCAVILLFSSCFSNSIYFDTEDQAIKSCNPTGMRRIYIENESKNDYYSIVWSDTTHSTPDFITLKRIQSGFTVYVVGEFRQIPRSDFKLLPSTEYTIRKSGGDASSYEIKIWTDSKGYVIGTDQPQCQ
jgi:hypothetical protein